VIYNKELRSGHDEITSFVNKKTSGFKIENRGAVPSILGMGFMCKVKTPEGFHQNAPNKKGALTKAPFIKYSRLSIILLILVQVMLKVSFFLLLCVKQVLFYR
jgi:hypothetical protein